MNRIREFQNKYQVLITPTQPNNAEFELLLGDMINADGDNLSDYSVKTYDTLHEARLEAYLYPDINWNKIILLYENAKYDIKYLITEITQNLEIQLMSALKLKNNVFDRVLQYNNKFNAYRHLNDILCFNITDADGNNIISICNYLLSEQRLRIKTIYQSKYATTLIGTTDLGLPYKIYIVTQLVNDYKKLVMSNPDIDRKKLLQKIISLHKPNDSGIKYKI